MQQENKESNIDIKGTLNMFIKTDEPELTQEEAIIKYKEELRQPKKNSSGNEDDDTNENNEEEEHLKRIKKELLESLERVKSIEKRLYGENKKNNIKKDELKVKEKKKENVVEIINETEKINSKEERE